MMGKQNCFKRSTAPAVSDFIWGTGCVAEGSGELGRLCGKTIRYRLVHVLAPPRVLGALSVALELWQPFE